MRYLSGWPRVLIVIFIVLVVTAAVVWVLYGRLSIFQTASHVKPDLAGRRQSIQSETLWLSAETEIKQGFLARYPGLNQIDLLLIRSGESSQPISLAFHLRENCDSQIDLRSTIVTVAHTDIGNGDGQFFPISFAPIDKSANRQFCFILEQASFSERGNVVGVWASLVDVYAAGQASYLNPPKEVVPTPTGLPQADRPASAFGYKIFLPLILRSDSPPMYDNIDIGFQLHYSGRPVETVTTFLTYLAEDRRYFGGIPGFYVILFVAYLVMVFLLSRIKPG